MYESYKTIFLSRRQRVLTAMLNRPSVLNAIDAVMHEELSRLFYDVAADPDADVIILTGAGRAFSAGGDIHWMQEMIDEKAKWERTRIEAKKIVFGMLDCEKSIIARVHGVAVGLGATMALFSDIIIAAEDAKIADPHVRVRLVAGDGGAIIWPQLIGYARAKEYLMTRNSLTRLEAARIGLVNHALPESQLDEKVAETADTLCAGAKHAIRYSKAAINIGLKQLAHSIMDASIAYETMTNSLADHQEAVTAFLEKRKPSFSGGVYPIRDVAAGGSAPGERVLAGGENSVRRGNVLLLELGQWHHHIVAGDALDGSQKCGHRLLSQDRRDLGAESRRASRLVHNHAAPRFRD
jgi:enoyl-CoA hydratase